MDIDAALDSIVASLRSLDPYRVILFGSYANGCPDEHSDIDLMVILDSHHVSKTHDERLNKKLQIRRLMREVNREVSLDILVYSRAELKKLKDYGNYFINEVEKTGKVIYEKAG